MSYVWVGLIAAIGAMVQSATGFGYAMICMALWPLVLPLKMASLMEVVTAFFMVVFITVKLRRHIRWRLLVWPLIMSTLTSAVGVFTLVNTAESILKRILGVVLILLSLYFIFFSGRVRLKPTVASGVIAGSVGGFLSGLFNIGGPPMVVYFISVLDDKEAYSATLQCYFCFTTVITFALHMAMGNLHADMLPYSAAALAGLGIGVAAGFAIFKRLTMKRLKQVVYAFMAVMGVYLALTG